MNSARRDDEIRIEIDQLEPELREPLALAIAKSIFDDHVLALDISEIAESPLECQCWAQGGRGSKKPDPRDPGRLLRPNRCPEGHESRDDCDGPGQNPGGGFHFLSR